MNNREKLHADIMRRVRLIYVMRVFGNPLFIEAALLVAFAAAMCLSVSIPSIISNISQFSHFTDGLAYIYSSTIHTTILVQFFLGASLILGALIFHKLYRTIRNSRVQIVN